METGNRFNFDYRFLRKSKEKNKKKMLLLSIGFLALMLFLIIYSLVSSFTRSPKKTENVNQVFEEANAEEERLREYGKQQMAYQDANIPYRDPEDRFLIEFVTPYVSTYIRVVINTNKDYDKVKAEADKVIENAKKRVEITSIIYIDNF